MYFIKTATMYAAVISDRIAHGGESQKTGTRWTVSSWQNSATVAETDVMTRKCRTNVERRDATGDIDNVDWND